MQRDVRVCFDLVDFLTYHMHDVGITEQKACDLSRLMRMTDTRNLKYIHGMRYYLEVREILTDTQKRKFAQLIHDVRADPAYADEHVRLSPLVRSSRPRFVHGLRKIESRCDLFTCCRIVVQATRGLL